jgi:phosphoenolpyruvate synthase/pyruvate phosphate dikinase
MEAIRRFGAIGLADVELVGGKGANLGELTTAGLPYRQASR